MVETERVRTGTDSPDSHEYEGFNLSIVNAALKQTFVLIGDLAISFDDAQAASTMRLNEFACWDKGRYENGTGHPPFMVSDEQPQLLVVSPCNPGNCAFL